MKYLTALFPISGDIIWQAGEASWRDEEGLCIQFSYSSFSSRVSRRDAWRVVKKHVDSGELPWLSVGRERWTVDLDLLQNDFAHVRELAWLQGQVTIVPDLEHEEPKDFSGTVSYNSLLRLYVTPEDIQMAPAAPSILQIPPELVASVDRLRADHPNPDKTAFIMMRFGTTKAHDELTQAIRDACSAAGITALRADDKQYHDDLFPNVLTYVYGCGIGVAVFERLEADDFNPNVSLEVGYMMALNKPVCLLKDKTLKTLHTDLVGKLYKSFDPQEPGGSIEPQLTKWLSDKSLI